MITSIIIKFQIGRNKDTSAPSLLNVTIALNNSTMVNW